MSSIPNIGLSSSSSFGAQFGDVIVSGGMGSTQATNTTGSAVPVWVWGGLVVLGVVALLILFRK